MEKFDVHKWNRKRRLAEINENEDLTRQALDTTGFLGDESGAMEALYDAITRGKKAGIFNQLEIVALEKVANNLSNRLVKKRGG
jgi:hypothetical protein